MNPKPKLLKRVNFHPSKKGLSSETPIYTGIHSDVATTIEVLTYDEHSCSIKTISLDEFKEWKPLDTYQYWVNVTGINNAENIKTICEKYNIHILYQEDILNIYQRPKIDEEFDYIFCAFKELRWLDASYTIEEEQYSLVLMKNTVLTFQEAGGDAFDQVREKLKTNNSYYRGKGVDYLFYRFLDITIDNYFDILEKLGQRLESIEDDITLRVRNEHQTDIQDSKKDIMQIRKNIVPVREIINKLLTMENPFITDKTKKYFKDVHDHILQAIETTDNYREINVSLKDLYISAQSHEMNKVIKVLTIISTFFIPLTFLVGVYGMNFKYMPELEMPYGYYAVWVVMFLIVIFLSIWFKRKGWF